MYAAPLISRIMEFRQLGKSGLRVPVLCFGAATFGGGNEFFKAWGDTDVTEAAKLVDICLEAGVNFFDTADIYSQGISEEVLGQAIRHVPRESVLISSKGTFPFGEGPNDTGSSRYHLTRQIEGSLQRLKTDYIDVYHMHGQDLHTPPEETLSTLDQAVRQGKIRYIAASNFSGWNLQKSLETSSRHGWPRYTAHQVYYSLVGRDYEWELMPQAQAEGLGALIWSPLGWGRLTGKIRRGQPVPEVSRLHKTADQGPPVPTEFLYQVVDALDAVAAETGKTVPQVALNWLLRKPTISSVIIGARNEQQLRDNLAAASFVLTPEQVAKLDEASQRPAAYPYWHQKQFPALVSWPPSYRE
ncbi:MAG TPA: aldo/keto reductase [Bryobacteraceae bacterium]|nr:aldo/keto reductase [Bryobacteraceae bacterium]